jgi:hypothetical protein
MVNNGDTSSAYHGRVESLGGFLIIVTVLIGIQTENMI